MKILYVVHQYWPNFQAGTENYTHFLAKEMAALGNDVYIIAVEPDSDGTYRIEKYDEENAVHIIKVHKSVKINTGFESNYIDNKFKEIFEELFKDINPDIVHIQHLMYTSIGIVDIIKKKNIPIIYTLHDLWLECLRVTKLDSNNKVCKQWHPEKCMNCYKNNNIDIDSKFLVKIANKSHRLFRGNFVYNWILKKIRVIILLIHRNKKNNIDVVNNRFSKMKALVSKVDLFISPSEFLRREYIKWGIPEDKIIYSRNGMNIIEQDNNVTVKDDSNGIMKFVFTSQVREHKGVTVLLDAFEILSNNSNVILDIYGTYDEKSDYGRDFVKRVNKLKNVNYKGGFNNTEINNILGSADYLILPSIWPENAPLVIEEAYLNDIPCIVSNIGGMAERIDDKVNGLHFRVGDANDLAVKIQNVVENPQLRNEFIKNIPHVKTIRENAIELTGIYDDRK